LISNPPTPHNYPGARYRLGDKVQVLRTNGSYTTGEVGFIFRHPAPHPTNAFRAPEFGGHDFVAPELRRDSFTYQVIVSRAPDGRPRTKQIGEELLVSYQVPQRNPIRFTGPSLTLMPFNPFQKVSIDLFGAGYDARVKNPYNEHESGWEVPQNFWPENMPADDFDRWVAINSGMSSAALAAKYKLPKFTRKGKALSEANARREGRGLPRLTLEEWRRWLLLDVVDQKEVESEAFAPRSPLDQTQFRLARPVQPGAWNAGLEAARRRGEEERYRADRGQGSPAPARSGPGSPEEDRLPSWRARAKVSRSRVRGKLRRGGPSEGHAGRSRLGVRP
jgi:hypothetical protein